MAYIRKSNTVVARVLALCIPLLCLGACGRATRVKLTATVEAHGVLYKGTVVNSFTCGRGGLIFGDNPGCKVWGDAMVIPLGPDGYAFMTLSYPSNPVGIIPDSVAYGDLGESPTSWDPDISLGHAPRLVRFRDINDPKSIEQINPLAPDSTPGFTFKSLHAEITREPITFGVAPRYLPWFKGAQESKWGDLEGDKGSRSAVDTLTNTLGLSDFERQ